MFRWTTRPAVLPKVGEWVPAVAPGLPDWLRPFGGQVLVAVDRDGTHLAGVGIKRHDAYGAELSVVTSPAARGRGLARGLVAQAARRLLDAGALPTYLHDPANVASARVAEAAGFPDRGWTAFGISEAPAATSI
ncbi:GNAT family N-acetyltransferase [Blastococcus sp. SYSU DS0510]